MQMRGRVGVPAPAARRLREGKMPYRTRQQRSVTNGPRLANGCAATVSGAILTSGWTPVAWTGLPDGKSASAAIPDGRARTLFCSRRRHRGG